jgi:hypothetical protein
LIAVVVGEFGDEGTLALLRRSEGGDEQECEGKE